MSTDLIAFLDDLGRIPAQAREPDDAPGPDPDR